MSVFRQSALMLALVLGADLAQGNKIETIVHFLDKVKECSPSEDYSTCSYDVPALKTPELKLCGGKIKGKLVADDTKISLRKIENKELRSNCGPSNGPFSKAMKIDIQFQSTFRLDLQAETKDGAVVCELDTIPFEVVLPGNIPFAVRVTPKYRVSEDLIQYLNTTMVLPVVGEGTWYHGGAVVSYEVHGFEQTQQLKALHTVPVLNYEREKVATMGDDNPVDYDLCFSTFDFETAQKSKDFITLAGYEDSRLPEFLETPLTDSDKLVGHHIAYAKYDNKDCTDEKFNALECIREQSWELDPSRWHMGSGKGFKGKVRYLPTGIKGNVKVDWERTELDTFSFKKLGELAMNGIAIGAEVNMGIGGLPTVLADLIKPMEFTALTINLGTTYISAANKKLNVCHDGGFHGRTAIDFGMDLDWVPGLDEAYADPGFSMWLRICPKEKLFGKVPICDWNTCAGSEFKLNVMGKEWEWPL